MHGDLFFNTHVTAHVFHPLTSRGGERSIRHVLFMT
uniref:Uncharacterized protein n=1 Tax=mine drainage metagenome TaxID=410659 RepID=E6QE19_9ZZZZ